MDNAVLILTSVAAMNVDSYNRSFKAEADIQNGSVFKAGALSSTSGEGEVFTAEAASATDTGLYMAFTAEDSIVTVGTNKYKFNVIDPRLYTNKAGLVFSGFRLVPGDRITIAGGIAKDADDFVVVNAQGALEYASSAPQAGTYFSVVKEDYIIAAGAGNGAIGGSHRLDAVQLEVVRN